MTGAKMATRMRKVSTTSPTCAERWRSRRRSVSSSGVRAAVRDTGSSSNDFGVEWIAVIDQLLLQADARVEVGVGNIYHEVDRDENQRDDDRERLDHRVIAG